MTENNPKVDAALAGLDEGKRATLKVLFGTSAFMPPLVLSFAMADLSIDAFMHAAVANYTTPHVSTTTGLPGTSTTPGPVTSTTPGPVTTTAAPATTPAPTTTPRGPHPTKS